MNKDIIIIHRPKINTKLITLGLLFSICFGLLFANGPDTLWTRTFGSTQDDWAYSVDQSLDGGYIIAGYTFLLSGEYDVYLLKTDSLGDTLWTNTYGETIDDWGYSVQNTLDGGYIIAGYSSSSDPVDDDVYLLKTDSLGNKLWANTYGGLLDECGYSVDQTSDGGYIIAGYTSSPSGGMKSDVYLIKTDSLGDTLWTHFYGGVDDDCGYAVQQTSDGGYIIAGYTVFFGTGVLHAYIIKTDSLGYIIWTNTIAGLNGGSGYSVQQTADGGYIIAGVAALSTPGDSGNIYVAKIDKDGSPVWVKLYGSSGIEKAYSVDQTLDGGYIIAGYSSSFGNGDYDVYLIKTDSSGDTVWTSTYGGLADDRGYSVQQTSDGGYIIAGYSASFGFDDYDVYLIKTKSTKLISPDGGEQLTGGSEHDITWWCEHPNAVSYRILFSTDGGSSFADTIADNINDDIQFWTWTVPDIDIGTCRIKIEVLDDTRGVISEDESNGDFTIGEPGISEYEITDPEFMNIEVFPNPFSDFADIRFSIGRNVPSQGDENPRLSDGTYSVERIALNIYDVTGRLVKEFLLPTPYTLQPTLISWDGRDKFGKEVVSGVYLMRFVVGDYTETKKLLLIR